MRTALFLMLSLTSFLSAEIVLDEVMSPEEQKKTGVAKLSRMQKLALEDWLDKNFVLKTEAQKEHAQNLFLSLNISGGKKIQLSDGSIWEIAPGDVNAASAWITPVPIKIEPSGDTDFPFLLINTNNRASVKARKVSP
ncbi:MAG: hypothetical protein JSS61_01560 [Verrucomicrobia bacterium]|nr:hypothetical protein [Verrucomicrobiota bacterium]